eukprot:4484966-Prymnesium_polylepis.1
MRGLIGVPAGKLIGIPAVGMRGLIGMTGILVLGAPFSRNVDFSCLDLRARSAPSQQDCTACTTALYVYYVVQPNTTRKSLTHTHTRTYVCPVRMPRPVGP